MPDMWMDVDLALSEVPVNILPLIDDTDFKTREVAIAFNQAGMDLVWNFVTTAGATTQTAVTPTAAGNYDWAHQGDGMYSIEIPAAGGADINNDTEGFGWFTGYCTGVLPWRGPIIGFRAAGLNNLLIDNAYSATRGLGGTALPDAAADAAGGLPISDAGGLDLDTQIGTDIDAILADTTELQTDDYPTSIAAVKADTAAILVDTAVIGALGAGLTAIPWNAAWDAEVESEVQDALEVNDLDHLIQVDAGAEEPTDGSYLDQVMHTGAGQTFDAATDSLEAIRDRGDAAWVTAPNDPTAAAIADAVWDEAAAGHVDAGKAGQQLWTDLDAVLVDTNELQTDDVPALIAALNDPTAAAVADAVWDEVAAGHVDAGKAGQQLWTDIDAILADTNELQVDWVDGGRLDLLIDAILADTGELQIDWVDGGRLDLIIDAILADTNELQTDDIPTLIAALNNLSAAQVNAEVVDALATDTYVEPGQNNPPATTSIERKIAYLYKAWRNRKAQVAAEMRLYNDDAVTVDQKAAVSDDGVTFISGEVGTGP